jgi:hypothetical protein
MIEIEETISVGLLSNLSSNFRSPQEAIFELVDNGLASRLDNAPVHVTITGAGLTTGGDLKVVTKGGAGMGLPDLSRYFDWGKDPDAEGLNRYGQGGKAAIGYLGKSVRIRTNAQDEEQAYEITDSDWLSRPGGRPKRHQVKHVPPVVPGEAVVEVHISGLKRKIHKKKLVQELAWRYRPALLAGDLVLRVKGAKVEPVPLEADPKQSFEHVLVVSTDDHPDGGPVLLRGWVGIAPPKSGDKGGIRCSAYGRVIVPDEYFGHPGVSRKASLNSLVGEVDLSFASPTLNKNAFDTADPAWLAAQDLVHREMEPFIQRLLQRKEPAEATDEERERAMEAKDLAHRALEKIAAESLRSGRGGRQSGRKPPTPTETPRQQTEPTESRGPQEPVTPPPATAVGKLKRKGASLDWDVRALDPRIRSATEIENGRTEIVVNKRYPLYVERDGDIAYLLETGLMEELKPGEDDDKTVGEYHGQLTDALLQALSMLR